MQQQYMRVPFYNDYSTQLPPQHAAAAAQHPMLAPRPVDPATMGYNSFSSQIPSSNQMQIINGPPFYYHSALPGASAQPPTDMQQAQFAGQPENVPTRPMLNEGLQMHHLAYPSQANIWETPQPSMQNVPRFTSPIGQTAEEYASNLSSMPTLNAIPGGENREAYQVPQVC